MRAQVFTKPRNRAIFEIPGLNVDLRPGGHEKGAKETRL